jgi:hypothetical protein
MSAFSRAVVLSALCAVACIAGGCMPGMTYKMTMPPSVTLGTQKSDQASMASSETRSGRVTPAMQRASAGPLDLQ